MENTVSCFAICHMIHGENLFSAYLNLVKANNGEIPVVSCVLPGRWGEGRWTAVWKKDGASSLLAAHQPLWDVLMELEVVGQGRSSWKWFSCFSPVRFRLLK